MTLIASLTKPSVDAGIPPASAAALILVNLVAPSVPLSPGMLRYNIILQTLTKTTFRMDLHENSDQNSVTATFELPGLKKEDVTIDVHNGRLTVSGESKMSQEHEESGYAVRERKYGKFARTLQLPQGVKVSDVMCGMQGPLLTMVVG
jgi:HSP20 family molecular chaperone IbpA